MALAIGVEQEARQVVPRLAGQTVNLTTALTVLVVVIACPGPWEPVLEEIMTIIQGQLVPEVVVVVVVPKLAPIPQILVVVVAAEATPAEAEAEAAPATGALHPVRVDQVAVLTRQVVAAVAHLLMALAAPVEMQGSQGTMV